MKRSYPDFIKQGTQTIEDAEVPARLLAEKAALLARVAEIDATLASRKPKGSNAHQIKPRKGKRKQERGMVDQRNPKECFRACVASLLGIEIDNVPHIFEQSGKGWAEKLAAWLTPNGIGFVEIPYELLQKSGYWSAKFIASGISPRMPANIARHSVLFENDKMIHDPHPSRAGLVGEPQKALFLTIG